MHPSSAPGTAVPPPPKPAPESSRTGLLAFSVAAGLWLIFARRIAVSAASGLAVQFALNDVQPLLEALLLLFLVVLGLALLRVIEHRSGHLRSAIGLHRRSTSVEEWATGVAIGWGISLASVLSMALGHSLDVQIWNAPRAYYLLALGLMTLAALTLAFTVVIFGYAFPRLVKAVGPSRATLLLIALAAIHALFSPAPYDAPQGTRLLVVMLAVLLLCVCWLRTHAVWLAWGLLFAWAASTGILFGLPLAGDSSFASAVDTRAIGRLWLTGGAYGPAAAAFSILILILVLPLLFRITDDYAWDYTRRPIVSGGYDVTIAPPAAHVAMEETAAQSSALQPGLVQIQSAAPPPMLAQDKTIPE